MTDATSGSGELSGELQTSDPGTSKRRRNARTALACTFCRQRKARCSGDWPTCVACSKRNRACVYPGHLPSLQTSSPQITEKASLGVAASSGLTATIDILPSEELRKAAISYFREHYAPTLLCFIPPQKLVQDTIGETLPLTLLLCIIALVSRCIPAFSYASENISPSAISDRYAKLAQQELDKTYEEPSLANVQCCLILCIYEIGDGAEHRGWLRLGHATRLAQLLQLHRQDSNPSQLDWGNSAPSNSLSMAECKRRTFWCCFCLERLLANGRDRIAMYSPEDITTQFPQSDENFIYDRRDLSCTLNCSIPCAEHGSGENSLLANTIRIVYILSNVMTWHGRGGRHLDPRCPWLPEMPFTVLSEQLRQWRATLPEHMDYTPRNIPAVTAAGQGKLWSFMFMIYFQARAYLYREYLPFTPKKEYDPADGPCDGPTLTPSDSLMPANYWYESAAVMVDSANAISDLYKTMASWGLSASAYPFPGLGLLTAASIHAMFAIFAWPSMQSVVTEAISRDYLRQDMDAFNHLGQQWSLAIHWIRQVSLYYKLNSLTKRSWSDSECNLSNMNIKEIKDGIMNYVRQIRQQDRETRELSLKATFDFDGWLSVLDSSVGEYKLPDVVAEPDAVGDETSEETVFITTRDSSGIGAGVPISWLSNIEGLTAVASQAEWMFDGWDSWAFDS